MNDGKLGTMTIKAKAVTANDELVSLKQQVSELVAVVKDNYVQGNPKGTTQQKCSKKWKSNEQKNPNIWRS